MGNVVIFQMSKTMFTLQNQVPMMMMTIKIITMNTVILMIMIFLAGVNTRDGRPAPPRGKTGCPAPPRPAKSRPCPAPPRKIDEIRGAQRGKTDCRFH